MKGFCELHPRNSILNHLMKIQSTLSPLNGKKKKVIINWNKAGFLERNETRNYMRRGDKQSIQIMCNSTYAFAGIT